MSPKVSEHDYLRQHNVVQLFDDLTSALLTEKPPEPTTFIIDWLKQKVPSPAPLKINTSNFNKFREFQRMFARHDILLEATSVDLREIDAEPEMVVAHKATQVGDNVVVEDTQLDVEGADVGVNVKWLLDHLHQFEGRKAVWTVLMGMKQQGKVDLYRGVVQGRIVKPRGNSSFGFDSIFEPLGSTQTLAQDKPDDVNARWLCVDNLARGIVHATRAPIIDWEGKWQD